MYQSVKRLFSVALLGVMALLLVLILAGPSYSGLGPALPAQDLTPWSHLPLVVREPTPTAMPDPADIKIDHIGLLDEGLFRVNREYVLIRNEGGSAQNMEGWQLTDQGKSNIYTFPGSPDFPGGFTLEPGASVRLRTCAGNDTQQELFWDKGRPVWDPGDTAYLYNDQNELIDSYTY